MKQEKPVLIVFAGPNGSGKSTMIEAFSLADLGGLYINADDMVRGKIGAQDISKMDKQQLDKINVAAANEADWLRQEAVRTGKSFATETVMSTPAKIDLMRQAKAQGYEVRLLYVTTRDSAINIGRVQNRVKEGGHDVPREKIAVRYARAMKLLPEAIRVADIVKVYDNSLEQPVLIMEKITAGDIKIYRPSPWIAFTDP